MVGKGVNNEEQAIYTGVHCCSVCHFCLALGCVVASKLMLFANFYFIPLFQQFSLLCLVLVELKAQCYRAYVCVRNTCCSCNVYHEVSSP